jgi:hypothetical protein
MQCSLCNKEHNRNSKYCSQSCCSRMHWKKYPEKLKESNRKWRTNNSEKAAKNSQEWHQINKEKSKENKKRWDKEHPKMAGIYAKKWSKNNRKKLNDYVNQKYHNDINYKIGLLLRGRVNSYINFKNKNKFVHTMELIGCSLEFFRQHLERLMMPEMNWGNFGVVWEIDHIIPCFMFDLDDVEEQKKCFHWSNQRPLWKTTEIAKGFGYNETIGNRNRYFLEIKVGQQ